MLVLTSVATYYGNVQALKGISLHVNAGEIVALIGANGAGKTTTLHTISGLLAPRRGAVTFLGERLAGRLPKPSCGRGFLRCRRTASCSLPSRCEITCCSAPIT